MDFTNVSQTIANSLNKLVNDDNSITTTNNFTLNGDLHTNKIYVGGKDWREIPRTVTQSKIADKIDFGSMPHVDFVAPSSPRKLYRHSSNKGTVIEFNDGQNRKVLVLDSIYRTVGSLTGNNISTVSLPTYEYQNTNGNYYIHGTDAKTNYKSCSSLTDSILTSTWRSISETNTSTYNTDVWETNSKGGGLEHCRNIKIDSIGCSVPNINTLMRIYCDAILLDYLDPSVGEDSLMTPYSFESNASFSTWVSSTYHKDYKTINLSRNGLLGSAYSSTRGFIIPVLDLN